MLPIAPTGLVATAIERTTVVIGWQELPPESQRQEAFSVYYKPVNDVKFEMVTECNMIRCDTIRYNTVRHDTVQCNTIQYKTRQYDTI